jgi:hypothetical protein
MTVTVKNRPPFVVPDGVRRKPSAVHDASGVVMQIIEAAKKIR